MLNGGALCHAKLVGARRDGALKSKSLLHPPERHALTESCGFLCGPARGSDSINWAYAGLGGP